MENISNPPGIVLRVRLVDKHALDFCKTVKLQNFPNVVVSILYNSGLYLKVYYICQESNIIFTAWVLNGYIFNGTFLILNFVSYLEQVSEQTAFKCFIIVAVKAARWRIG